MWKKPLNEKQVRSIRQLISGRPLHELLLNLSVDLMLRGSDLLNLKVSDVMLQSGKVRAEVKIPQKKTVKSRLMTNCLVGIPMQNLWSQMWVGS